MIQSTEYVLAPDFISSFKKFGAAQAEACTILQNYVRLIRFVYQFLGHEARTFLYIPGMISQKVWPTTTSTNLKRPAYPRMEELLRIQTST